MAVVINEGTQTSIRTTTVSAAEVQHVRPEGGTINAGTVTVTAGTIVGGTVQNLNFGTIDIFYRHPDAFATVVSTGTNTIGTIKAGVSGSAIYVNWLTVSAGSATNVEIGNGGTNLPLIGTLFLNANGGAVIAPLNPPINTSSGSALVYKQSTGGPLSISCGGYVD